MFDKEKPNKTDLKNIFSVDVEDGVSLAMTNFFGIKTEQTERVVKYTEKILELLERYETIATFFVLGQVAEVFPKLVKIINEKGHEVGVHGYNHLRYDEISKDKVYNEINDAKKRVEDLTGKAVYGHRAPAFTISRKNSWALDIVAEAGFLYDSSIMPAKSISYGWEGFGKEIGSIKTDNGSVILEVPMSTIKFMKRDLPICGGSYLRMLPISITKRAINKIQYNNSPAILYLHPYELDTERYPDYYFRALNNLSIIKRHKMKSMWINRKTMHRKLENLLNEYHFTSIYSYLKGNNFSYLR